MLIRPHSFSVNCPSVSLASYSNIPAKVVNGICKDSAGSRMNLLCVPKIYTYNLTYKVYIQQFLVDFIVMGHKYFCNVPSNFLVWTVLLGEASTVRSLSPLIPMYWNPLAVETVLLYLQYLPLQAVSTHIHTLAHYVCLLVTGSPDTTACSLQSVIHYVLIICQVFQRSVKVHITQHNSHSHTEENTP